MDISRWLLMSPLEPKITPARSSSRAHERDHTLRKGHACMHPPSTPTATVPQNLRENVAAAAARGDGGDGRRASVRT